MFLMFNSVIEPRACSVEVRGRSQSPRHFVRAESLYHGRILGALRA